jgi:hypothetical protein
MRLFGGIVDSMEAQPRFILRKWASVADGKQCYEEQKLGEDKLPGKSGSLQLRHRGDSQLSGIMLFPYTWKLVVVVCFVSDVNVCKMEVFLNRLLGIIICCFLELFVIF